MQIRRLHIEGFRGIEDLTWHPGPGVNCLIGSGDLGKTTILEAITLLLSPAPGRVAAEYDYFNGRIENGFCVDAVVGEIADSLLSGWSVAPLWSWDPVAQRVQPDPDQSLEAVMVLRVKGTPDLEIKHFLIDPSEGELPLSPAKRQRFGLSRLGTASDAYRELRMTRGSLLARNVDEQQLRAIAAAALKSSRDEFKVPADIKKQIDELSTVLHEIAPGVGPLGLGMLSPRGQNLLSLLSLFSSRGDVETPLANAGRGTQQLALFALAEFLVDGEPMYVADEVESGLEPFRQRELVGRMRRAAGQRGQVFLTTHSPAVVESVEVGELYRASEDGSAIRSIQPLPPGLERFKRNDAEGLLSRMPVLVEGETELGLLLALLAPYVERVGTSLGALGVRLVDGGGQPHVFSTSTALQEMDIPFGAFLDDESHSKGKRDALIADPNVAFGSYTNGAGLEEALSSELSIEQMDQLVQLSDPTGHDRSTARYQAFNEALGAPGRASISEGASEKGEDAARAAFAEAANNGSWFKSRQLGQQVGSFLLENAPGGAIAEDVASFWSELRSQLPDHLVGGAKTSDPDIADVA